MSPNGTAIFEEKDGDGFWSLKIEEEGLHQICFKKTDGKNKTVSLDFSTPSEYPSKKESIFGVFSSGKDALDPNQSDAIVRKFFRSLKSLLRNISFQQTRTNSHQYPPSNFSRTSLKPLLCNFLVALEFWWTKPTSLC